MLTSRAEPQLNLHRLRLAGELTEIRASDLRFSREEVGELLQASEIELSDEAVALLHERTEGWVAGLRLAAISLGRASRPGAIRARLLRQRAERRRISDG